MYEEFLRNISLFANLSAEELTGLCQILTEIQLPAGDTLFAEGELADRVYILKEGALLIVKHVEGREVFIDLQDEPGTVIGEIALLEETKRLATLRAHRDSILLSLERTQVHHLLNKNPLTSQLILRTLTQRWRGMEALVHHNEKMAQLGTLTAGIAHELNNPAGAIIRGASQLHALLTNKEQARISLERSQLSLAQQAKITELSTNALAVVATPPHIEALTRSDQEADLEAWLTEHGIQNSWELAPALVNLGLHPAEFATLFRPEQLPPLIHWLTATYTAHSLLHEIAHGAGRIADIVRALKLYVYLDQSPVQDIDIQASIENTLLVLGNQLGSAIQLRREYTPDLPHITGYGSELNQVWTNILLNAVEALNGKGEIVIRTRPGTNSIEVEFEDNGPGIPAAHLSKIFDPFFTTKSPGQGSGLGLNISYNIIAKHHGNITVTSAPGRTCFTITLPTHLTE